MINKFWGRTGFDSYSKLVLHAVVEYLATIKGIYKLNAEDNTDALLAEAEYIFNHADQFCMEEDMLLAA